MSRLDPGLETLLLGIQRAASRSLKLTPLNVRGVKRVCGVDVAYAGEDEAVASAVLASVGCEEPLKTSLVRSKPLIPYVPGFLFMREAPAMLSAILELGEKPDLVLVDGHGILHPRRAGLAVFVGLALELPAVGVAKSLLAGEVKGGEGEFKPVELDG